MARARLHRKVAAGIKLEVGIPVRRPTPPELQSSASGTSIVLAWPPAADVPGQPITQYRVFRSGTDNSAFGGDSVMLPATARAHTFSGLSAGSYSVGIIALTALAESLPATRAAAIAAAPPEPPAPPVTGTTALLQGVYREQSGGGVAPAGGVPAYETWLGYQIDIIETFVDEPTGAPGSSPTERWGGFRWPNWVYNGLVTNGAGRLSPMIGVGCFISSEKGRGGPATLNLDGVRVGHDLVPTGVYDDHIREQARSLLANTPGTKPIYIRLNHEFNIDQFGHRAHAGREGEFVASWRHYVTVQRSVDPTRRIKYVWNPSLSSGSAETGWNIYTQSYQQVDIDKCYPGDDFVDRIGPDCYDQGYWEPGGAYYPAGMTAQTARERNWARKRTGTPTPADIETTKVAGINCLNGIRDYAKAGATRNGVPNCAGKPFSAPEIGLWYGNNGGGDNPYFTTAMTAFIKAATAENGGDSSWWEHGYQGVFDLDGSGGRVAVPQARSAYLAGRPHRRTAAVTGTLHAPAQPTVVTTNRHPATTWVKDFEDEFTDVATTEQQWNINTNAYETQNGYWAEGVAAVPAPYTRDGQKTIQFRDGAVWIRAVRDSSHPLYNNGERPFVVGFMSTERPRQGTGPGQPDPVQNKAKYRLEPNGTYFVEGMLWNGSARGTLSGFWLLGDTFSGDTLDIYGKPRVDTTYVQHWDGKTGYGKTAGWPTGGEVDILEFAENNVGEAGRPFSSLHWARDHRENEQYAGSWLYREFMGHPDSYSGAARPQLQDSWHTWGLYRSPYLMVVYIDGVELCRWERYEGGTPTNPATSGTRKVYNAWDGPHTPASVEWWGAMHIVLTYSPGPGWGGQGWTLDQYEDGEFGARYVKVWKKQ